MPDIESIVIYTEMVNGSSTVSLVGDWPARTSFTPDLLESAASDQLQVAGDEIIISLANATATYRRVCTDPYGVWICDLVERCRN